MLWNVSNSSNNEKVFGFGPDTFGIVLLDKTQGNIYGQILIMLVMSIYIISYHCRNYRINCVPCLYNLFIVRVIRKAGKINIS